MTYKTVRKPLAEIARELNVDAVVEGSVLLSGERVRITAELIEVRAGTRSAYAAANPHLAARPAHSTLANHAAAALGVTLRPWHEALAEHLCGSA